MNRTPLVICLVSLIVLASARDPIYSSKGTLSGDILRGNDSRIKGCLETCPTVRSLLVVCGTDGKSYANKGSVECADKCLKPFGESVKFAYDGYCPEDVPPEERN
ncbi:uncharacterized protein LOC123317405 [Coccinella septempunctata]|uniref:uncharacterized protein LOC123317405 n=1 Tax=Coccinella septempunctata TaxID=41139 RepID=UPI001D07FDC0|nr:uncharacterized protein LOC123317405 [Coccinella septempunctata]